MNKTFFIADGVDKRVVAALQRRGLPNDCAVCGWHEWTLLAGYVTLLIALQTPGRFSQELLPSVAMVCKNCGNTHLLNLIQLGLGDLIPKGK